MPVLGTGGAGFNSLGPDIMKLTKYAAYFIEGFNLSRRSLDLLLIYLLLSLTTFINLLVRDQSLSNFLSILSVATLVISTGFTLSLPLFFTMKQDRNLSLDKVLGTTLNNIKRFIVPGTLLTVGVIVVCFIIAAVLFGIFNPSKDELRSVLESLTLRLVFAIFSVFLLIFEFTAIYFSIERKSLIGALKASAYTSFNNLGYLGTLAVINLVHFTLISFIPPDYAGALVIGSIFSYVVSFFLNATTLIYYQKAVKNH